MNQDEIDGTEAAPIPLDAVYAELIETVWACERRWELDDHIDAAIRYGGSGR